MKKKMIGFVLCATMVGALTACGGNSSSSTPAPTSTVTSKTTSESTTSETVAAKLSFISDGEIYFDINLKEETMSGFAVSVDGTALGESKKLPIKKDSAIEVSGTGSEDGKVMFYIVTETKDGDHYRAQISYSSLDADGLTSMLAKRISNLMGDRTYVAVTDQEAGWDHNLSEALNKYIQSEVKM